MEMESSPEIVQQALSFLKQETEVAIDPKNCLVRVYSELLKDYLWIVPDSTQERMPEVIYTHSETGKMKGLNEDSLKKIHKVKKIFPLSKIEVIKKANSPIKIKNLTR